MTTLLQVLMELPTTLIVLLKMSVLLGAGWVLHFALVRRNRRWRVFVWRGVIAGLLLLPVAELVLPRLEVPVAPAPTVVESAPEVIPYEPAFAAPTEVSFAPMTTVPTVEAPDPPGMFAWMREHFSILLLAAWALVATIMAMKCLFGVKNVRRMVKGSRSAPTHMYRLMEKVAEETRCRNRVNLRLSPDLGSPFLAGLIRPVMVLPERMADEDHADELPAVLAHELAHLNSCDLVWMTLGRWLSVLLWFHPLAWKVRAAHATACEQVCDAVAADYAGGAPAYSRTLARLALELVVDAPAAGGIPMIRTSQITRRLQNLKRGIKAAALARPWVVASVLLGCVTLFGIGCLKLVTADRPAAVPANLRRGLVLHYSFDADNGRIVTDLSGKGNHGRVHSGTYIPDGKIGGAMFFDVHGDIGDSIDIGADPSVQTDVFTLAAWIRTSFPLRASQTILGFGRSAFAVTVSSDGRIHYSRIRSVPVSKVEARAIMEGGGGLSDVRTGEWVFVAVTRDADDRASIYVNGEFEEWYITDGHSEFYLAGQIGGQFYRGEHFSGAMDEIRMYNRALSASEIKQLYEATAAAGRPTGARSSDTAVEGVRIEPEDWGIPITGVVRDESGKPAVGALVLPLPHGGHPAETDENGEFELAGPSRGSQDRWILNLFARDPERYLAAAVKLGDYSKPIDITLTPAVTVTGRVTDPQGNPMAGAGVRASVRTKTYGAGFGLTVWPPADRDGRFALKALPLGYEYRMGVSADEYASEGVSLGLLSEPGIEELEDIILQPAGESLTRTVSDSSSENASSGPPRGGRDELTHEEAKRDRRIVQFPEARSMGTLYVRDPGAEDWYMDVEELGEARGRVAVPKGKELKLEVSEEAAQDLSPLAKLRPDDLQMVGFWFKKTKVGSLAPLANLTGLRALNLQNARFNCEDFSYLTGMTKLEVLRLGDHQLTDESLRHIGKLSSLKSLALWSTGIGDEGLKHLQDLRNLTFLALNNCAISDHGLEYLKNMAGLEGLQLRRTAISDDGLAHLKGLTKLKSILLDGNNITDEGLTHLQNLASLEIVSINDNPITDEGLAYLSDLGNLKALYVGRTQITDAGMVHLEGLKHIWHMYLTGVGDEALAHLSGLPALEFVQIHDAKITEASIASLTKMKSLKRLLVSGEQVYEDLLVALRAALPDCEIYDPQQGDYPPPPWRKRFDSVYRLEDDEVLRRIPPPFIPERMDFYRHEHSVQAEVIPGGPDYFTFHWDKKLTNWGMGFTDNLSLQAVLHRTLGLESFEYEGPQKILSLQLPGDWIVRPGAPMRAKLSALEQIVANDLGLPVRFEERSVQRDVIVADGKYEFHPEPNAYNDTSVHIFADKLDPDEGAGGGTGTLTKFLRWVGNRVSMPIINETEMPDDFELSWGNHRSSRLRKLLEPERSRKLDMVVANLARQTSLTFTKERREVDVWFVSER